MTNLDDGNVTLYPGDYGIFEISWTPSGKGNYTIVAEASVTDSTIGDSEMEACMLAAVKKARSPRPRDGESLRVAFPFVFSPIER